MSMMGTDDSGDLEASMLKFQAAASAAKVTIPEPKPGTIVLALDGSNQDATAEGLAVALARRRGVAMHLTYAYEGPADAGRDRYLAEHAEAIAASGLAATFERGAGRSYEQILAVARGRTCGLVVTCAPYLEDIGDLGEESVGTNLDMLMSRAECPLLVARAPKAEPAGCFAHVVLPIAEPSAEEVEAAGWALYALAPGGTLRLLILADRDLLARAREVLGETLETERIEEPMLYDLLAREHAGLIAALQKHAAENGLGCRVSVRSGEPVPAVLEVAGDDDALIVAGCPQNRRAEAYQRTQAIVRESRNPVLIV